VFFFSSFFFHLSFYFPANQTETKKTNRSMHKNNESTPKSKENTTKKKKKEREKKSKTETGLAKNLEAGLFGNKLKLKNHKNKKWIRD